MKFLVVFIVTLVAVSGWAQTQEKQKHYEVDFSGKWRSTSITRDTGRIELPPDQTSEVELTIEQSGHELRVTETTKGRRGAFSREVKYFLDGRGESNDGFSPEFKYDSKTQLKKRKLAIEATIRDLKDSYKSEEWKISDDGQILTIETQSGRASTRYNQSSLAAARIRYFFKFKRVN